MLKLALKLGLPLGIVNSLKFRLILSAGLMILLVLPLIGFTLSNAFEQKLTQSIKRELSAYSYAILAVTEVENNQLIMPEQLPENQFNVAQSGLYATITQRLPIQSELKKTSSTKRDKKSVNTLWQSYSLLDVNIPKNITTPDVGKVNFSRMELTGFGLTKSNQLLENNNLLSNDLLSNDLLINSHFTESSHFVYSYTVSFTTYINNESYNFPLTIHIIKSLTDFELLLHQFQQQLWGWLLVLMLLLVIIQAFWLIWTLKPLHELKQELEKIEQGKLDRLQNEYPVELSQVTNQLNLLLATEQGQRKRYRNALADLAHSLKTPLAVIQSEPDISQGSQQQLAVINQIIEHQLKRAQTAGESAWYLGVNVNEVITKLLNSLAKIYHDKSLTFINDYQEKHAENSIFKGDEADLLELLGNLLDNACKAAKSTVFIDVKTVSQTLIITIADDGLGISDSMQAEVLQRGIRADTYQQGHGIGLAIVRDLVSSYQGDLTISQSKQFGGAEFTLTFTNK